MTFNSLRNLNPQQPQQLGTDSIKTFGTSTVGETTYTWANGETADIPGPGYSNGVTTDPTKAWFHFFDGVKPGDRYTIRVCPYDESSEEQICDNIFGESGEFNILKTIDMITPVRQNTYKPGDFVPITWQSYYVEGNTVDVSMYYEGRPYWSATNTTD